MTIREEKQRLRAAVRAEIRELPEEYFAQAGEAMGGFLQMLPDYRAARTVFCHVSTAREADTRGFLERALRDGKRVCVPRCVRMGEMELRRIDDLRQLTSGAYGLLEPPAEAPLVSADEADFSVVPCLCCTLRGERLGKGGGFYDRFLARGAGTALMLCPARLIQPFVPMEAHDCAVSRVLTENGLYVCGNMVAPARKC